MQQNTIDWESVGEDDGSEDWEFTDRTITFGEVAAAAREALRDRVLRESTGELADHVGYVMGYIRGAQRSLGD